ncbi:MAG TPA: flagellar biosynthetic protein FliO [Sedimenticola sp.]|nr:flagellar biosynthetic protein FliO [Sedimenticola sp.]
MHRFPRQAASGLLFSLSHTALAGTGEGGPAPLGAGALLQSAGGLLLILGLIFALAWLLRRFGRLPQGGKGLVRVVGGVSLGPRERAVVLQVEGTRLLVGVAPGRVQTLMVLEGDAAGAGDVPEAEAAEVGFAGRLQQALGNRS